ncbi:hypothetical protein ATO13_16144 [Stappia sp. 22II-S9-Z10]|nr:hypothetical protein ATO13_16144 [Stappia sp. 22II-S9-Z10]
MGFDGQLRGERTKAILAAGNEDEIDPVSGDALGEGFSDAGRRAGDEGELWDHEGESAI